MRIQNNKENLLKSVTQPLVNFISILLEVIKYKDNQLQPKYILVDWVEKKGIGYCKIHTTGTSSVNDYPPELIVGDDEFISGFGKIDIRTITNLAHTEKNKALAIVTAINHDERHIEIKEIGKDKVSINIDSNIEKIIDKFSKKDVFNLGRVLGEVDTKP